MISIYGALAALIGVLMAILTFREFYRGKIGRLSLLFWMGAWIGLVYTALFPDTYLVVAAYLGLALPINFITTFSIIILFLVTYQLYRKLDELNRKLTRLVQQVTLSEVKTQRQNPSKEPG